MALPLRYLISIPLLLSVLVIAHFSLVKQAENNGTFSFSSIFAFAETNLPGTDIPIRLPRTGIAAVDNYFKFMVSFFWVTLDTRNVRAHLQGHPLIGTLSSVWTLMLLEAHRTGRSTTFLLTTYVAEVLGELLGIGLFTPIWCIFHLLMTAPPRTAAALTAPKGHLQALGWAIVIGHVVPTALMIHSKPYGEGFASQQIWTIARLFHPVFVFGAWKLLMQFQKSSSSNSSSSPASLSATRKFHQFSILASGFFHVGAIGLLTAQHLLPNWISDDVAAAIDIWELLIPYPYWNDATPKLVTFTTGVATFLQWDNICAVSAALIWAASLHAEALAANKVKFTLGGCANVLGQTGFVALLAGPAAAAAYLLQERDDTVLAAVERGAKKTQ